MRVLQRHSCRIPPAKQKGICIPVRFQLRRIPKPFHRFGYAQKEEAVPLALPVPLFSGTTARRSEQIFLLRTTRY